MTIIVDRTGASEFIADEIERLERLLADLKRIQHLEFPTANELDAAPIIDYWAQATRAEPCLVGYVHGHPRLDSRLAMTSGLWVMAKELGWARTLSRFYRLGRPAEHRGADA